jgi:hypothetical protein
VSREFKYVQYADDHFKLKPSKDRHFCLEHRPAPTIRNNLFIGSDTVDWFFQSLATVFPDVMVLSPFVLHWDDLFSGRVPKPLSDFLQSVKDRRPQFVMHPLNLPENLNEPRHDVKNPDNHYILTCIKFDWSHSEVSSKVSVLDPYSDQDNISETIRLYRNGCYFTALNPVFDQVKIDPIQLGHNNIHCGVYILALALNAVFGTLSSMNDRLNPLPEQSNTLKVGLLLRTCVAWDCTQFPSLLDTCLLMSPTFAPIPCRRNAVTASEWWCQTPYHNIADSLAIKYGHIFIPVYPNKNGTFLEQNRLMSFANKNRNGKISADGPFFFQGGSLLVKVNCIGLIGHRLKNHHAATKRAAAAFQEACATQYHCNKKSWFCETFGLICVGLVCPTAFVCVVRMLGTAIMNSDTSEVSTIFYECSNNLQSSSEAHEALRVVHGDPHRGNIVLVGSEKQLIDHDRTYLIIGDCPPRFLFTWYASSVAEQPRNTFHIRALMRIMKRSGLEATREYFSAFYTNDTFLEQTFNAELFEKSPKTVWEYDAFLHLFELMFEARLEPQLISDFTIHCKLTVHNVTICALDSPKSGNIVASCEAKIPLHNVCLQSASDTIRFFEAMISDKQILMAPAVAPEPCPISQPGEECVGFWHLMELLRNAAIGQDQTPQLQTSHDKSFISCGIRPVGSRDNVVPCKIFFEYTEPGKIKICSAEFDHLKSDLFVESFRKQTHCFNLKNHAEAIQFFDYALSMTSKFDELDSTSGDDLDDFQILETSAPVLATSPALHVRSLPDIGYLLKNIKQHGNANVLQSIKVSMRCRFGDEGSLKFLKLKTKPNPKNVFREEHFGCETVLVDDEQTQTRCITFVKSQTHLSLDTETTVPRHDDHKSISLIQIGTSTNVFIIQVARMLQLKKEFFSSLGEALIGKTLLCWENEKATHAALQKILVISGSTHEDVQKLYSSSSQLKGLDTGIQELFDNKYVLNKNWRLSGWDNDPLSKGQLTYAALDVVCCHALYVADKFKRHSVYQADGNHITFYAFDIQRQSKVKHGFSFAPDFLGHYNNGTVSRGFHFSESRPLKLQGFGAPEDTNHRLAKVDVQRFVYLLNDFKFCCALCTSCWFRTESKIHLTEGTNLCSITKVGKIEHLLRDKVSDSAYEQNAYDCLSILASVLELSPSEENLHHLNQSVRSDIYYGYIRETLGHLEFFSSSPSFFGHYVGITAIRGFRLESSFQHSFAYPEGFKAASGPCDVNMENSVFVFSFTRMLNLQMFCCSQCTDSFTSFFEHSPVRDTIPAAPMKGKRCFAIRKGSKYVTREVGYDADKSLHLNNAIFCLSMLRAYFGLNKDTTNLDDSLLYSVLQDVNDGYISKTLAFLVV